MLELLSRFEAARARIEASRFGDLLARLSAALAPLRRAVGVLRGPLASVRRSYGGLVKGWHTGIVYHDGRVTLDRDHITLHGYYLPFGRKRIPYDRIRHVYEWPLTGSRAYRVHGVGRPRVWYARDARRGERTVGLLLDVGAWLRPVITPDDPGKVAGLLRKRIDEPASGRRA